MSVKITRKLRNPIVWDEKNIEVGVNTIVLGFTGTANAKEFQRRCDEFGIIHLIWKAWADKKGGKVMFYKDSCDYDCSCDEDSDYSSDDE